MKTPQKEHGHIQIATGSEENDVFGALAKANLSGVEFSIVLWVIRKTWGYNKKTDHISLTQFEKALGFSRSIICRRITRLVNKRILVTEKLPSKTLYGFNKHFSEWKASDRKATSDRKYPSDRKVTGASDRKDNQLVTEKLHTKETLTKETNTKESIPTEYGNASVNAVVNVMQDHFGNLDGTKAKNRQYAWLLLKKAKSLQPNATDDAVLNSCLQLVRAAAQHNWWKSRITKVETLYKNAHMITKAIQEELSTSFTPQI